MWDVWKLRHESWKLHLVLVPALEWHGLKGIMEPMVIGSQWREIIYERCEYDARVWEWLRPTCSCSISANKCSPIWWDWAKFGSGLSGTLWMTSKIKSLGIWCFDININKDQQKFLIQETSNIYHQISQGENLESVDWMHQNLAWSQGSHIVGEHLQKTNCRYGPKRFYLTLSELSPSVSGQLQNSQWRYSQRWEYSSHDSPVDHERCDSCRILVKVFKQLRFPHA